MIGDITKATKFYIVCGHTDLRSGINGLSQIISLKYNIRTYDKAAFFFCGHKKDRLKVLLWEDDGYVLIIKRFENGRLKWPRNVDEIKDISEQQLRWLLEGLDIEPKKSITKFDTSNLM